MLGLGCSVEGLGFRVEPQRLPFAPVWVWVIQGLISTSVYIYIRVIYVFFFFFCGVIWELYRDS